MDLVFEFPSGDIWAIEIKRSLTAKVSKGFHIAREDLEPTRLFVVYAGEERFPATRDVEGIGVRELATMVRVVNRRQVDVD